MTLIDEKGTLFGKVNIIDFIIIIILLLIFASTVYLFNSYNDYKNEFNSSDQEVALPGKLKLRLILETSPIPDSSVNYLKEGDREIELSSGGDINSVVEKIKIKDSKENLKILEIQLLVEPRRSFVYFFYSSDQPIKIGEYLNLKFPFLDLERALIKEIEIVKMD